MRFMGSLGSRGAGIWMRGVRGAQGMGSGTERLILLASGQNAISARYAAGAGGLKPGMTRSARMILRCPLKGTRHG
jgi:hypothetical protein